MRTQITVYLDDETKIWLTEYASLLHQRATEVVRLLVEREKEVEWLKWALQQPDPAQDQKSSLLSGPKKPLPKRSKIKQKNSRR